MLDIEACGKPTNRDVLNLMEYCDQMSLSQEANGSIAAQN